VPLPSSYASSVAAESEMGMVCSQEGGSAPTRVTDQPTHSPAGALSNGPSAPATPVLSPGIYTTWRDAPQYSGKFNHRIPPELHEKLAMTAEAQGLSLNALAQQALQRSVTA
jgi:hypothetical protein